MTKLPAFFCILMPGSMNAAAGTFQKNANDRAYESLAVQINIQSDLRFAQTAAYFETYLKYLVKQLGKVTLSVN
ncbi:hypothetical protein [Hufsiella ginkgonis]|uniref:hypothetical protein n=1 Tax=Hufsiella ginkgonis TaxID=2695274 RepID=UPI0019268E3D|nr:hypothetical protein [Hufsiella ginkgonis]